MSVRYIENYNDKIQLNMKLWVHKLVFSLKNFKVAFAVLKISPFIIFSMFIILHYRFFESFIFTYAYRHDEYVT